MTPGEGIKLHQLSLKSRLPYFFYIIINALHKLPAAVQFGFNLDVGLRVISPANSDVTVIVCLLEFNLRSGDGLKLDYVEEN